MKRCVLVLAVLALGAGAFAAPTTYSAFLGADFFEYETTALETGLGMAVPIQEGLAFEASASYEIKPARSDPFMAVPLQAGVRFSFDATPFALHCSVGLEPVFVLKPSSFRFGPYLGLSGSIRVHEFLELFADVEQSLLFGGSDYVSTGTKILGGLRFSLSD